MSLTIPPDIIEQCLREGLLQHYAIEASLSRLPGENLNYLVTTSRGPKYVAKLAGDDQSPQFIELEFAISKHGNVAGLRFRLPQIVANLAGALESDIRFCKGAHKRLRIIEYLPGKCLQDISDISDKMRFETGKAVAEFGLAMRTFDHPEAHRNHRWKLTEALQHQAAVEWLEADDRRDLLAWAFRQFAKYNTRIKDSVTWQFIHGDLNPENILVADDTVTGIVDFGDCGHNPAVCDLAICLAYQMMGQQHPAAVAGQVIAGYESVRRLPDAERQLLFPLVCARLAVTLSVATQRRRIDPDHPNWFVSEAGAWQLLARLQSEGDSLFD